MSSLNHHHYHNSNNSLDLYGTFLLGTQSTRIETILISNSIQNGRGTCICSHSGPVSIRVTYASFFFKNILPAPRKNTDSCVINQCVNQFLSSHVILTSSVLFDCKENFHLFFHLLHLGPSRKPNAAVEGDREGELKSGLAEDYYYPRQNHTCQPASSRAAG